MADGMYDLPSYEQASSSKHPFHSAPRSATLLGMPDHILLHILSHCDFFNLQKSLRPACTRLNWLCLSLLRKAALPHFQHRLAPPYASGSMPMADHRTHERHVLDLFIAALAQLGQLRYETDLHILSGDDLQEAYPYLFTSMQPTACLQDLVQGVSLPLEMFTLVLNDRCVELLRAEHEQSMNAYEPTLNPSDISFDFSKRRVWVLLPVRAASSSPYAVKTIRKKIFELPREFDETLQVTAQRVVKQLAHWNIFRDQTQDVRWYTWN